MIIFNFKMRLYMQSLPTFIFALLRWSDNKVYCLYGFFYWSSQRGVHNFSAVLIGVVQLSIDLALHCHLSMSLVSRDLIHSFHVDKMIKIVLDHPLFEAGFLREAYHYKFILTKLLAIRLVFSRSSLQFGFCLNCLLFLLFSMLALLFFGNLVWLRWFFLFFNWFSDQFFWFLSWFNWRLFCLFNGFGCLFLNFLNGFGWFFFFDSWVVKLFLNIFCQEIWNKLIWFQWIEEKVLNFL